MAIPEYHSHPPAFTPSITEPPEQLHGWAKFLQSPGYIWHPTCVTDLHTSFSLARHYGLSLALRGAGHSYNDAALNRGNIVLDFSQMRRILEWNPERGIIRVEPGVTIDTLWRTTIKDGWWPPVVPTTSQATLGGCLAMNVHGKNSWNAGSIGEHILAIELLLSSGNLITVTPSHHADIFYAVCGGLGFVKCQ